MPRTQRKLLGRYIVADPAICHGKPTFLGTRIMVAQVLKQVAKGMPWERITAEWRGSVTKDAIAEAVELAQRTFEDHAAEYARESQPA
jgi:uncharacterized protein (DUF433 family)